MAAVPAAPDTEAIQAAVAYREDRAYPTLAPSAAPTALSTSTRPRARKPLCTSAAHAAALGAQRQRRDLPAALRSRFRLSARVLCRFLRFEAMQRTT